METVEEMVVGKSALPKWDLRLAGVQAIKGSENFDPRLHSIPGFASRELRFLIHELCSLVENPRYLEVGVFFGATFSAAMQGKEGMFIGLDNFNEFSEGARLVTSSGEVLPTDCKVKRQMIQGIMYEWGKGNALFYEQDYLSVSLELIREKMGGVNIFFYDGNHSAEATSRGIEYFSSVFQDDLILIVDDYNELEVIRGTQEGLQKIPFVVVDELLFKMKEAEIDSPNYGVYTAILQRK